MLPMSPVSRTHGAECLNGIKRRSRTFTSRPIGSVAQRPNATLRNSYQVLLRAVGRKRLDVLMPCRKRKPGQSVAIGCFKLRHR